MLSFNQFIKECSVPVVTVIKNKVDINDPETLSELNRNLVAATAGTFVSPYTIWLRIFKVMSLYGITLPKVIFANSLEGEEILALTQFAYASGAELNGMVSPPHADQGEKYFLYFHYEIANDGNFESIAMVVDEDGLNDILELENKTETDFETHGNLDPRQR